MLLAIALLDTTLTGNSGIRKFFTSVPQPPVILVGLKSDLRNNKNCIDLLRAQGHTPVTREQGQAVADRMSATYMECSSRTMAGVEDIFSQAIYITCEDDEPSSDRRTEASGTKFGTKKKKSRSCRFL